ncbi:MAG TPA: methyl-accepting chemotaxis protein [Longimicrobium sp.]|nr:methyl-accepting chemotaxis protein [Longimicrobium sp.]
MTEDRETGAAARRTLPFRWQMLLTSQAVVLCTLLLMLPPAYLATRDQVTTAHRERLMAFARGAGVAIRAGTVDSLAAEGPRMSVPYVQARNSLRAFWAGRPAADSLAPLPAEGLALVRREGAGWRVLAHSAWTAEPRHDARWTAPPTLGDSLRSFQAGQAPIFWFADGERLAAVAPVLDENSLPAGVVVAQLRASTVTAQVRRELLRLAWYPLLALAVATLLSLMLVRRLSARVRSAVRVAERVALGDLRTPVRVTGSDEVGQLQAALREMQERLAHVIGEVRAGAEAVSAASGELTMTSQHLAQGTAEQSGSVAETNVGLEQMIASITQNAENSRQMEREATAGAAGAEEGVAAVHDTVRAMQAITARISVIQEIASRTDLLSLNAAIEAARAGEHGRGFAVVAEEVRRLSERSQKAADEIAELARNSMQVAERSGVLIAGLLPSIRGTARRVQEVAAASAQQAAGVDEISRAMRRVDLVTEQNAAAAEELAATAQQLAAQSETLRNLIAFFRVGADHPETAPVTPPPPPPAPAPAPADTPAFDAVPQDERELALV